MASSTDPYAVLGLRVDASAAEIKRRYRELALAHHPDKASPSERSAATAALASINLAYETLSNPERRRTHDATREARST